MAGVNGTVMDRPAPGMDPRWDEPLFSTKRVAELTPCTYRQIDYWLRQRFLENEVPSRGSGSRRLFSLRDLLRFRALGLLLEATVVSCPRPGRLAQHLQALTVDELVSSDDVSIPLTNSITVTMDLRLRPDEEELAMLVEWRRIYVEAGAGDRP